MSCVFQVIYGRRRRRREISLLSKSVLAASMNSVGGFREGEIDGKPFFIFTLFSETDSPTSSSSDEATIDFGGDDLSLKPLFLCPSLRLKEAKKAEDYSVEENFIPFNTSPHFPSIKGANHQVQCLLDSDSHDKICKLPVVPLFWCNNKEPYSVQFFCGACRVSKLGTDYYICLTCDEILHNECVESPLEIKHPSYPFQSLQFYTPPRDTLKFLVGCICCNISLETMLYHFPPKLSLHPICAMKPIPIVIDHQKRHPHPLTFFPKQTYLPCDVCGLIKEHIPTYVCVRCVYAVHQDCIYFPNVIKISRHHHRVSFISSIIPTRKWSCGVCRQKGGDHCGVYSCKKCDNCFVHPRCALRKDVWDGEDLDGIPEEDEIIVEPFETIADGIILHFSHGHNLKLEIIGVYDEEKFCQACILPIYGGNYYSCMDQCDFILHEVCANAPRKKHHPLHAHPLTLKVVTNGYDNRGYDNHLRGMFRCDACQRKSCGFVYESQAKDMFQVFRLDLRCASVSEPFKYQGHEHPLFLALTPEEEEVAICQICHEQWSYRKLNCIECDYIICFKCTTLPYKARYKHDKHYLTFQEGKDANDHSGWCEVCESKIEYSSEGGFYACDDCCTTLHVDCLLGENMYMLKPGQTIMFHEDEVQILRNSTMSRPLCHDDHAGHRCRSRVVYEKRNMTFCSYHCCYYYSW